MRDYQTKQNKGGLPDTITSERYGAGEFNSLSVENENAVSSSGQSPAPADGAGEVSDQLAMALSIYGGGGAEFHLDTGAASAYVLNPVSPKKSPPAYYNGMTVSFVPGNTNTSAPTINVASIGVKSLTGIDGSALLAGVIRAGSDCKARFDFVNDRFELLPQVDFDHNSDGSHIVYSSLADVRASTLTPYDGQLIGLSGYASAGDGGGQKYGMYWDPSSTETDNNGSIIKIASILTGRFKSVNTTSAVVLQFGVLGDGITDDTLAIIECLAVYQTVIFPGDRTYMIDAESRGGSPIQYGVSPPSDRRLILEPGAKLQAITNDLSSYRVLNMSGVQNVFIEGGEVSGDKDDHTGVTGEAGHAIYITGSDNIHITGSQGNNAWGVGIGIFVANGVYVKDCTFDNNRQNGGALVSGSNIYFDNYLFSNTSGTAPGAGFDIEPNEATHVFDNVNFINGKTKDNEGVGFSIALKNLAEGVSKVSINIDNFIDDGSQQGLLISKLPESLTTTGPKGQITIRNPKLYNSQAAGLSILNYAKATTPKIVIDTPDILNCNTDAQTIPQFYSGITALRQTIETETYTLGNFYITNPSIVDDRTVKLMPYGIYVSDEKSIGWDDAVIEDPLEISGTTTDDISFLVKSSPGMTFRDKYRIISGAFSITTALGTRVFTDIKNSGGSLVEFNLTTQVIDSFITFTDDTGNGIRIEPGALVSVLPISPVADKYVQTIGKGGSITIRKVSDTEYYVEKIVGTWTVEP